MIKPLFSLFTRWLIAVLPAPGTAREGQWRSMQDEEMIRPLGEIYRHAGLSPAERILHRFVRLWVPLLGKPKKKTIRTGEVSGVYYPID